MLITALLLLATAPTPPPQVELRLLLMGYRDEWPKLELVFINESSQPVSLVLPGDGSSHGWRTPVLEWNITPDGEDPLPPGRPGMRCGNMNTLMLADTFTLAPGRDKRVQDIWTTPPFPGPGRFRVSLTYRNVPSMEMRGPSDSPEALARVRASTPIEITSNEVVIDWRPKNLRPRAPLLEGEVAEEMFGRIASCFGYGIEKRCTALQERLAAKLWQKCVTHAAVEELRSAEQKRVDEAIAKRAAVIVKTEPYEGTLPDDKKREGGFVQVGGDLVLVTDEQFPSVVVELPNGSLQQLFFAHARFAPIASCDGTSVPTLDTTRRISLLRVLSEKRVTSKPDLLKVDPVLVVEFPRISASE